MIEVHNLYKAFGELSVLRDVSFTAPNGSVTGFVGPNGAGKSTTMKIICGLERADSGQALVDGHPFAAAGVPGRTLGIHFSGERFPDNMTARALLAYASSLVHAPAGEADRLLKLVGLAEAENREATTFSMGMRQRLGIALALLGNPKNIMLDEPVNGLDPGGVAWVRDVLRSLADSGKAVLLSSHLMAELELIADHVVMLDAGEVVASGSIRELHRASRRVVQITTREGEEVLRLLEAQGLVVRTFSEGVLAVEDAHPEDVGRLVFSAGLTLSSLNTAENTLEDTFFELTADRDVRVDEEQ